MKTIILALLLVATCSYVYTTDPACSSPSCKELQKCVWNCVNDGTGDVTSEDFGGCSTVDAACTDSGGTGKCKPGCVKDPTKPDCSQTPCTGSKQCAWTCIDGEKNVIYGVDASGCQATNNECGQNPNKGTCQAGCLPAEPVCSKPCTGSCSWTCQDSDDTLPDADVTKCGSVAHTCEADGKTGTCTTKCTPADSGSSKLEIFVPFVFLGAFIKMCLQP